MQFSTNDNDNDLEAASCAQTYKGAWWYNHCLHSNLNGLYLNGLQLALLNGSSPFPGAKTFDVVTSDPSSDGSR